MKKTLTSLQAKITLIGALFFLSLASLSIFLISRSSTLPAEKKAMAGPAEIIPGISFLPAIAEAFSENEERTVSININGGVYKISGFDFYLTVSENLEIKNLSAAGDEVLTEITADKLSGHLTRTYFWPNDQLPNIVAILVNVRAKNAGPGTLTVDSHTVITGNFAQKVFTLPVGDLAIRYPPMPTPTPTASPAVTATPTPTPTPRPCPNYWTNCISLSLDCPPKTIEDHYGQCGPGFKCCLPGTIPITATPTSVPTPFLSDPVPTPTLLPNLTATVVSAEFFATNSSDDAYQQGYVMFLNHSQVKIGWYQAASGFRVTGAGLSGLKGKTITNATLNLTATSNATSNISQRIYLQASDSCPAFTPSPGDLSNRPTTTNTNSALWNIGTTPWTINSRYSSPNLATAVAAVTNRPNWDGQSLCLILKDAGSASYSERQVRAQESGFTPASLKVIFY